ncbi:MAG: DUF192 domain-containing protein [Elusimicrobia bacterium]|nr:DUF192 domain-containing protein [Elusimicrobiota bacterium]
MKTLVLALSILLPPIPAWPSSSAVALLDGRPQQGLPTTTLRFPDGKAIEVELAVTPEQREIGLMNRLKLPKDYGMLFVFPIEQGLEFWMKNTFVDLDMVFIDTRGKVTAVHPRVPRSYPHTPDEKLARRGGLGRYVLELPAGAAKRRKLKVGQTLKFKITVPVS